MSKVDLISDVMSRNSLSTLVIVLSFRSWASFIECTCCFPNSAMYLAQGHNLVPPVGIESRTSQIGDIAMKRITLHVFLEKKNNNFFSNAAVCIPKSRIFIRMFIMIYLFVLDDSLTS